MRDYKSTKFLLSIIFFLIACFFLTPVLNTQAATGDAISGNDFDDGITNWQSRTSNSIAQLPIGGKISLGYAFGLAQNTSGLVSEMGDNTITNNSIASGNNINYSKMNVFLNDGGTYISSVFQSGYKYNSTNKSGVSMTSPDFLLAPSDSTKEITAKNFSILGAGTNSNNNGNPGMTDKKYFAGTDENGNPAYKIVGNYVRTQGSTNNGNYDLEAEILLRASPSNSAIVQRELYLKNKGTTSQKFTILFGEDTKMGDSNGGNDMVPIRGMENRDGLSIQTSYNGHDLRLIVSNQTPDGFDNYAGEENTTGGTGMNWAKGFTPATVSGTGDELLEPTITKAMDTAYSLKWNPTTLAVGDTAHYSSTMGVTAKPYSIPTAAKTFTNESRSGSVNKVGDKLKFTLKMVNNGYGAQWNYKSLSDKIPSGLQLDTSSIKQSFNGDKFTALDSSQYSYDSSSQKLSVTPEQALTDEQDETITYEATITNSALNNLDPDGNLTNTATFSGSDYNISPNKVDSYDASVKIPVSPADFSYTFTKKVKNVTNNETSFKDSTTAKSGDTVDYFIEFKVNSNSKDTMLDGSQFTDTLASGLQQTGTVKIKGSGDSTPYNNGSTINTRVTSIGKGQSLTVEFQAKVTSAAAGIVTNTANLSGTTDGNESKDIDSPQANLNIQKTDSFLSVPTSINFGSTNMYGQAKTLNNISTKGDLRVSHPDNSDFNINVSYDNTNVNTQMINGDNKTLPTNGSNLLFIRQRNTSDTDSGTWEPISPTGTPIRNTNFSGNQDDLNLTNYVGVGDWQIYLSPEASPGTYNGTITWTMVDSDI